jgi:1-deoxy-D-xylulose 5-phosphate reductoisomerase
MFQGIWVLSVYSCTLVLEVVSGYFHHWHLETVVHQSRLNAVVTFLDGRIGFLDIERTVYEVCSGFVQSAGQTVDIDSVREADRIARENAEEILRKFIS